MWIIFSLCFLISKVNLKNNYISFEIIEVDDCVRLMNVSNHIFFNFTPLYEGKKCGDYTWENLGHCDANKKDMYIKNENGKYFVITNYEYDYGIDVEITFEDWDHINGFMALNAYFNEYLVEPEDQTFWQCLNCGGYDNELHYDNYVRKNEYPKRLYFYLYEHPFNCSEKLYKFVFKIDSINQLYQGGKKGKFKIIENFYSFTNQEVFPKYTFYSDDKIELELINFIDAEFLHVTSNETLPFNYELYYFKLEYEENSFGGNLKGLGLDNKETELSNENNKNLFKVNEESGLKYILSDEEKENRYAEIKVKISLYDYCPQEYSSTCSINELIRQKQFIFKIYINDTLTDIAEETHKSPDVTEKISEPSDTAEETHKSHDTTEQTSNSENSEQIQKSSDIVEQSSKSSDISDNISKDTSQTNSDNTSSDKSSNIKEIISDCLDNYNSYDQKNDIYSHLCPDFIKDEIIIDLNKTIERIDKNKSYNIIGNDFVAQIIPIDSSDQNNIDKNNEIFTSSYTNFTECEKILRNAYDIQSPRKLTFVQIELNNTNNNILVKQVEYQVYDDNNNLLNLSLCEKENITIKYSFKNEMKDEVDLIIFFKKNGIDILDLNDNFFNDVCLPYSDSEKDLTINDRIKDIYKNYTFCEKNCQLIEVNYEEYKAICDCSTKENLNLKDSNFEQPILQVEKKNNNFKLIKCLSSLTSLKDNLKNIGFWIFLTLMILNIIFLILYIYNLDIIKNYISKEMANHGYIGKSDADHTFCHNYIKKLDKLIEKLNAMKNNFKNKVKNKAPPKRKTKGKINRDNVGNKDNSSQSFLKKKIELLNKRMEKTKKEKNPNVKGNKHSSDKIEIFKYTGSDKGKDFNENNNFKLNLININVNDIKKKTHIPKMSDDILNIYNFKEAIKYDNRSLCSIYYIFLIAKEVIMHAFFYKSPMEPLPIRLSLLKYMLGCDLALNAIFYTDDKISEKYNSAKSIISFAFTNNLIVILLSTLIGYVLFIFLGNLNNSTNAIRNLFREEEEKIKNNKNYKVSLERKKQIICEVKRIMKNYKIKIIIFYIFEFLSMIFFWYYVTIFCNLYKKTQISWLIDSILTIIIRILIDLSLNIILSILYKVSLATKSNCLFRVIIFLYSFS